MPFTPSHIAAVLPLISSPRLRRLADPWALAIGAMVPDLPIFLPILPDYSDWHSWQGVVTVDLASVLILLVLFHGLFRDPLLSLLPPALAGRAATLRPSWSHLARSLPAIVAGALIGAASHVLWDSFTHSTAPAEWSHWLGVMILGGLPVFRLLQYVSSAVGLALVVGWAWRGLSAMPASPVPGLLTIPARVRAAVIGCGSAGIVAGAFLWPLVDEPNPAFGLASVITKVGAGTVIGLCLVLTCYAAVWQVRHLMGCPDRCIEQMHDS